MYSGKLNGPTTEPWGMPVPRPQGSEFTPNIKRRNNSWTFWNKAPSVPSKMMEYVGFCEFVLTLSAYCMLNFCLRRWSGSS